MTEIERKAFLSDIYYFWFEKGDFEHRLIGFTLEKLREVDPVLADAYERLKIAKETFERLLRYDEA